MQEPVKGDSWKAPDKTDAPRRDLRPTHDQLYLAQRINHRYDARSDSEGRRGALTPAILQRWNLQFGPQPVSDALRLFHGFVGDYVTSPYAYLHAILRKGVR